MGMLLRRHHEKPTVGVPEPDTPEGGPEVFDPSAHTVEEVLAYLQGIDDADPEAHDAEVVRVIEAEKAGKNRKGIVEAVEGTPEADPAEGEQVDAGDPPAAPIEA
jgi:hypothetical protein